MKDFARTKEDIVHECGILPADFVHAGAKDKLTMLACLTPEQAFRLGHVLGFGKGMESGYMSAAHIQPSKFESSNIEENGKLAMIRYDNVWHMNRERVE